MVDVEEGAGAWRTGQLLGEGRLVGLDSKLRALQGTSLFTFTDLSSNNSYARGKKGSYQALYILALADWTPLEKLPNCWKGSL